jgi:hypothetical protein
MIDEEPDPFAESAPGEDDDEALEMVFASVDDFVTEYLAQIIRRRISHATMTWCPSWWLHPEAIVRITALWRAFEYLRVDAALGMSTWWLQHADPHLRALMDPDYGPFALCDPRGGHSERALPPLPLDPSPPEMWDHPAFTVRKVPQRTPMTDGPDGAQDANRSRATLAKQKGHGIDTGL